MRATQVTDKYEAIREYQRSLGIQETQRVESAFNYPDFNVLKEDTSVPAATLTTDTHINLEDSRGSGGRRSKNPQFGSHLELIGTISQIKAQRGKIQLESEWMIGGPEALSFSLWEVTYGTHRLNTNDLTNLFLPGDTVAFTARVERKFRSGIPSDDREFWLKVIDVIRIGEHQNTESGRSSQWDEGVGIVISVKEDDGVIKTERWGAITFDRDTLEVKNEFSSTLPLYRLIRSGRSVHYRCSTPKPGETECSVVSVSPNGELKRGEGLVVTARETFAFVSSKEFGDIYVPFQAMRVPRERMQQAKEARAALFKAIKVGTEVKFEITKSHPTDRCPWRALSVILKT